MVGDAEDGDARLASGADHLVGGSAPVRERRVDVEHGGDAHEAVSRSLAQDRGGTVERHPQQQQRRGSEGGEEQEPPQPPPAWLQG